MSRDRCQLCRGTGHCPRYKVKVQVSNAAPERTMGCEDSAPLAACGPLSCGLMLVGFVVVDPGYSVVLASL
jgi:hypothetical protein